MNTSHDTITESRIASGVKAAALVVLLGLIAAVSQPTRMPDEVFGKPGAAAVTASAPAAPGASGETEYFASRYPAPTNVEEQPPTF
jgi:hypothetical protein